MSMAEVTWERVAEDARQLTPDEQQLLRGLLDSWITASSDENIKMKQRLLAEQMLADGLISHIPSRDAEGDYQRHPPIIVQGEPVSETIIRERR